MYLEYCHSKLGNFGDDLNPWMFPKLMPKAFEDESDKVAFLGIGTILDQKRIDRSNLNANRANIVFSSGAGFGTPPAINDSWHIYCVRGEHTARQLGVDASKVIADGAYLLRNLVEYRNPVKKHKIAFIPHHSSEDFADWQAICDQCGIKMITARQPVDSFLEELLASELVITEAMHGAIVSDALRVPWVPVSFSPKFMPEKWRDFTRALKMDLEVTPLPFVAHYPLNLGQSVEHGFKRGMSKLGVGPSKWARLPNAYTKATPAQIDGLCEAIMAVSRDGKVHQSSDAVVEEVTERLAQCLDGLYADFLAGKFHK
ncbi:polysaccharide pyruvyl transferase family protein [Ferrimonas sp.]|uniref:polysaccharide pyruvyl transferase family protein n=1 Tax=Ferrimonas sp. TaxID=2080861 RepID=UPI003A91EE38